jgi:hypothetical protein
MPTLGDVPSPPIPDPVPSFQLTAFAGEFASRAVPMAISKTEFLACPARVGSSLQISLAARSGSEGADTFQAPFQLLLRLLSQRFERVRRAGVEFNSFK